MGSVAVACACVEKNEEDKVPGKGARTSRSPKVKTLDDRQNRARAALSLALSGDDAQAIANAIAQCTVAQIPEGELIVAERALLHESVKWKELEGSIKSRPDGLPKLDVAKTQRQEMLGPEVTPEEEEEDYEYVPTPRGCTEQEKLAFRLEHVLKRCNLQELSDTIVAAEIAGLSRGNKAQQAMLVRGRQTLKKLQAKRATQQQRWAREAEAPQTDRTHNTWEPIEESPRPARPATARAAPVARDDVGPEDRRWTPRAIRESIPEYGTPRIPEYGTPRSSEYGTPRASPRDVSRRKREAEDLRNKVDDYAIGRRRRSNEVQDGADVNGYGNCRADRDEAARDLARESARRNRVALAGERRLSR